MSALSCAAAAALVIMCARFAGDTGITILAEVEPWPDELAAQADADSEGFGALLAAWRMPADDPGRPDAIERGEESACTVPLRVCELGQRLTEHARALAEHGKPDLEGDALTGLHLAAASVESATQLIRLNTARRAESRIRQRAEALRDQTRVTMRRLSPERQ
jgi:formiminotetrahydrofolate cyclodeaminase